MPSRLIAAVLVGLVASQPVAPPQPAIVPAIGVAPVRGTTPNAAARVERARLMASVADLPTRRSARADEAHLEGLYKTQGMIERRLKDLGLVPALLEVDFIGSTHDKKRPLYNIVAEIPGRAPAREGGGPREVVLVGAHFDAVPGSPGADDNATGVAALLEMARVLKDEPLERSVRLCFFNLEEQGMVGSSVYANDIGPRLREKKEKIVLMLSLDMLGYYRTEQGTQKTFIPEATGFKSPKEGDFIAVVTTLRHRPACQEFVKRMHLASPEAKVVSVDFLPALADLLRSDHAPFLGMGIPSLLVTDTADYRNPHYHKPTDEIGTLDAERFELRVKALVGAVAETAGVKEKAPAALRAVPRWGGD
jgi:Zn-dependent M28 family amino/carboxypeptidase